MVRKLQSRHALEKWPQVPRLVDDDPHVDIDERAQRIAAQQIAQRQHAGTEAKLKVDGGNHATVVDAGPDSLCSREVCAHGLLHEDDGPAGQLLQHFERPIARHRDVVDHVRGRTRLGQRVVDARQAERCRRLSAASRRMSKMPAMGSPIAR